MPSVRNSATCDQPRALAAPLQHARQARCARCSMVPSTSASSAIGSAKALLGHGRRQRQARRDRLVLAAERLVEPAHAAPRRSARRAARAGARRDRPRASGPWCASSATISGSMRSAATGSGSIAASVSPRGTMRHAFRHPAGEAASKRDPNVVPRHSDRALAPRHGEGSMRRNRHTAPPPRRSRPCRRPRRARAKPWRASRVTRSRASAASPPNRCAQPVMSSSKPVRRIEPDQRRVAVAPVGDRFEQAAVGLRIGVRHRQRRIHRARVGERHAGLAARAAPQRRSARRCAAPT